MKLLVLALIRLYQKTFSPDHGFFKPLFPYGFCRYHPTCSQYAFEAVEKFGVVKGLISASARIFRCNPWASPALDPVVKK
ncbi:MAG: membrane protein insertion efficiency factor YidD [Patescibacteria group bacterium]